MTATRVGLAAYNGQTLAPRLEWGYDTYEARLARAALLGAFAEDTIYTSSEPFGEQYKIANRLYRHIRDVHSPVKIALDLISANVYQGTVDAQNLTTGALPFVYANSAIETPLRALLKWSNLPQFLAPYVRTAAAKGDAAWWIVDDPQRQRVRLELMNPIWIRDKVSDESGNIRAAVIEYEREEEPRIEQYQPKRAGLASDRDRKTYLYTLKITREDERDVRFETFRDGDPFAFPFHRDADGTPVSSWTAPYGFVPLVVAPFEPGPGEWGMSMFFASLGKINEVNDAQSLLNDTVRRVIEPILKAKNISADARVDIEPNVRDGITVLYVQGENADIEPVVIPIDLDAAGRNIDRLNKAIERELPILQLGRMLEQGERITGPGVRAGLSNAIGVVEMARRNLDSRLIAALKMGITIGAIGGYPGFDAFNADSYDNGDMELELAERPVIADQLTRQEKLTWLTQVKDQPPSVQRLMLKEMSASENDIQRILAEAEQAQQTAALDADIESILSGLGNADGDDAATPQPARNGAAPVQP